MKNLKQNKGITLVALVITIIILLILVGVAIASLDGENGLLTNVKLAKKAQIKAEMKEQLVLALTELQLEKNGEATLDDVTQEWADSILEGYKPTITSDASINGKKITMSKSGEVVKYIIDEKLNIIETEETTGSELTYEVKSRDGENLQVLVIVTDNENGLQTIEYNDGHIQDANGLKSVSRDCTIQLGVEYKIKITSQNGTETEKSILLEEPKEIDIPDKIEIALGKTAKIEATLNPKNAIAEIIWTIEDETIVEINNGEVKGLVSGSTTVTASVELINGTTLEDTCQVNVYQKVTEIKLNKTATTIALEGTETLTATILPENASNKNLTWKSSDETVAIVTDGTIKALKKGQTTITAIAQDGSDLSASCIVTVENSTLTSLITGSDYGKPINYEVTVEGVTLSNWRVFYNDKITSNVYIILDGYLENSLIPEETNMIPKGKYQAYWNDTKILTNAEAVETLTNIAYWEAFASGMTDATAIGGPTSEMFVNSWNNNPVVNSITLITGSTQNGLVDSSKLYLPYAGGTLEGCYGYWLASTGPEPNVMNVDSCDRYYMNYNYGVTYYGIRPLVCLPSRTTGTIRDSAVEIDY